MTDKRQTVLIVYYSETGHTRAVAEALDKALDATLEPLAAPALAGRTGFWMFCWRAFGALAGRSEAIDAPRHDPAGFDLVVLASPVWAGRLSTPMRGYLARFGRRCPRVAYVTTQSSSNPAGAMKEFAHLTGQDGVARLSLSDADRRDHRDARLIADFAGSLAPTADTA
jgi:menaquinone-dependent protoporphyrinogen IX oxidase